MWRFWTVQAAGEAGSETWKGKGIKHPSAVAWFTGSYDPELGLIGKLKWHYRFTPHDVFDWDATEPPVLADMERQGQPRKPLLQANRNGFFYVLERTNGKLLLPRKLG